MDNTDDIKENKKKEEYTDRELMKKVRENLGFGCGNPAAFNKISEGNTVLNLGSGGGVDCFIASKRVGDLGKVIGVDISKEMVERARINAEKGGYANVEFINGKIDSLPIKDNSVDIVISNCVINHVPDKLKAFEEIHRVLRSGGSMHISELVLYEKLTPEQQEKFLTGYFEGTLEQDEYLENIRKAGFSNVNVLFENKKIEKKQYNDIPLEGLIIEAIK